MNGTSALQHRPTRWWAIGATIGTLLLTGACGKAADPQVATLAPPGEAAAATAAAKPAGVQGELADFIKAQNTWVACMKKKGVDLPDPDAKGVVDTAKATENDAKINEYGKAYDACNEFFKKPSQAVMDLQAPPLTPAQITAEKELAVCIRDNGVPEYSDPDGNGKGGGLPEDFTPDAKTYDAAFQKCIKDPEYVAAYPEGIGVG